MYAEFSNKESSMINIMDISKEDIVIIYLALEEYSRSLHATNPNRTDQIAKCLNSKLGII